MTMLLQELRSIKSFLKLVNKSIVHRESTGDTDQNEMHEYNMVFS